MWSIEINDKQGDKKTISLTVLVDSSIFLDYLLDRSDLYPTYIRYNKSWFSIRNPYQPYLTPFPGMESYKIKVNEPLYLRLPKRFVKIYRQKYEFNIVNQLLEWLDKEYKSFQKHWKLKAKPISIMNT